MKTSITGAIVLVTALHLWQTHAAEGQLSNSAPSQRSYTGYSMANVYMGNPRVIDVRKAAQAHTWRPRLNPAMLGTTNSVDKAAQNGPVHARRFLKNENAAQQREKRAFRDPCNPSVNVRYLFNDTLREGWNVVLTNRSIGTEQVNATYTVQSQNTLCGSAAIEFTTDANFLVFNTSTDAISLYPLYRYFEFYRDGLLKKIGAFWISSLLFIIPLSMLYQIPAAVIEGWVLAEGKGWQHVGIRLDTYLNISDARQIKQVAIYQQTAANYTRKTFYLDQIRFSQEEYIWALPTSMALFDRTQYNVDKPKITALPDHSFVVAYPRLHIGSGSVTAFDIFASVITDNGTDIATPLAVNGLLPFNYDAMMDTLDFGLQMDVLEMCTDDTGRAVIVVQDYRKSYPDLSYAISNDGKIWSLYQPVFPAEHTPPSYFASLANFTSAFASLDQHCNLVACYANFTRRVADQECFFARYLPTPRESYVLWDTPRLLPTTTWANISHGREYPANIVTTAPNTLLVVWCQSDYIYKDGAAIFISSNDSGLTWSEPHPILYEKHDSLRFIKPTVASNDDGHVVLVYNAAHSNVSNRPNMKVFWSNNSGYSWTYFWISTDYFASFDVSPSIAFDGNRNWVVAYNSLARAENNPIIPAGTDPDILYVHSIANGSTWTVGELANIDGLNDDDKFDFFPAIRSNKHGHWGLAWMRFYNQTRSRDVEFSTCYIPQAPEGFTCTYDLGRCEPTLHNLSIHEDTVIPGTLSTRGGLLNISSAFFVEGDIEVEKADLFLWHGNITVKADLTLSDITSHLDLIDSTVAVQGNLIASGGIELRHGFLEVSGCLDGNKTNATIYITEDDLIDLTRTHNVSKTFAHFNCINSRFNDVRIVVDDAVKARSGCQVDATPQYVRNSIMVAVSLHSCLPDGPVTVKNVETSDWMAENAPWLWPVLCLIFLIAVAVAIFIVIRKNHIMRNKLRALMNHSTAVDTDFSDDNYGPQSASSASSGRLQEIF